MHKYDISISVALAMKDAILQIFGPFLHMMRVGYVGVLTYPLGTEITA